MGVSVFNLQISFLQYRSSNLLIVATGSYDLQNVEKFMNETGPEIARKLKEQGAPRITAPHVPIGPNAGEPNNIPQQTAIVKESLEWVRDCPSYNGMKVLPYEYRHNV